MSFVPDILSIVVAMLLLLSLAPLPRRARARAARVGHMSCDRGPHRHANSHGATNLQE